MYGFFPKELYTSYLDDEEDFECSQELDPFWEPPGEVLAGTGSVFLQSLGYAMDCDEHLRVADYHNVEKGTLSVALAPCDARGGLLVCCCGYSGDSGCFSSFLLARSPFGPWLPFWPWWPC